jgi:hypothetical protein
MNEVLLYAGSAVIFLWGIGHLAPTKPIVADFGTITADNKRIITMEWIAEGLTLCFIGVLVFVVTLAGGPLNTVSKSVYWMSASMLVVLAIVSSFTGARTSILPMKLCPFVKTAVAIAFILGSIL